VFFSSLRLWLDVSYGFMVFYFSSFVFRNINVASADICVLFISGPLEERKRPHSGMMDEVIKLEGRQNESRGVCFWAADVCFP